MNRRRWRAAVAWDARITRALVIAELQAMARSPLTWLLMAVVLLGQGFALAAELSARTAPGQLPPLAPVLERTFVGTPLTYALVVAAMAALTSRSLAEARRAGLIDGLAAAGVSDRQVVVSSWLAAVAAYACAWVPTLALAAGVVAAGSGTLDTGVVLLGMLAAVGTGAALLAVAVMVGAWVSQPYVATVVAFAAGMTALMGGEWVAAWTGSSWPAKWSLHTALAQAARGWAALDGLLGIATVVVGGLAVATGGLALRRRRAGQVWTRLVGALLVCAIGVQLRGVARDHNWRFDVTRDHVHTLSSLTVDWLRQLESRASGSPTVTLVRPTLDELDELYQRTHEIAASMAAIAPIRLAVIDGDAAEVRELSAAAGLAAGLGRVGGVVVSMGVRRVAIDLGMMITVSRDPLAPHVERSRIEQELVAALAQVTDPEPFVACATAGHGELGLDSDPSVAELSQWAARLREVGADLRSLDRLDDRVPSECQVLLVLGPVTPFSPSEALAVQHYLADGGGVFVAAAARPDRGTLPATGLEPVVRAHGIEWIDAVAFDPTSPDPMVITIDRYSDHVIHRGLAQGRPTAWLAPRALAVGSSATPLLATTAKAWGERNWTSPPPRLDADDVQGPVVVAAASEASGGRLVVLGSAESLSSAMTATIAAGHRWGVGAVRWLARRRVVPIPEARLPQIRLAFSRAQSRWAALGAMAGLPGLALCIAVALGARRWREGR